MTRRLPILYRDFDVELLTRATDGSAQGPDVGQLAKHDFSVSSEIEVERADYWTGKRFKEVLIHEDGAIDKSLLRHGLSVLNTHAGEQIGVFEAGRVEGKKLRGNVIFSRSQAGQDHERDVVDGIKKYVSIGYRVLKAKVVEVKDDVETWHITRWMPMEVSLVPMPADPTVGHKRDQGREELYEVEIEDGGPVQEERTMQPTTSPTPEAPGAPATPPVLASAGDTHARNAEVAEIFDLAAAHGVGARASEWVRGGLTKQQVGLEILSLRKTEGPGQPASEHLPGSPKDMRKYSYLRAINMVLERGLNGQFDGIEGEVHQELVRTLPDDVKRHGGIQVPMRTRTLDSKTATKGIELVDTEQGDLIEILRNQAMVLQMGARLLTNLQGPVAFPKQTGAATVYWVPENPAADVADSDLLFGQVNLVPKTMQGSVVYSRQLLAQASVDVEAMVREDLAAGHSLAIDRAAIHGSGVNSEPTGIYVAPDVNAVAAGGVPNFGKFIDMQSIVADKNAYRGSLGYLTTPLMAGKMKQTLEFSGVGGAIWTGTFEDGIVGGYKAVATNQVSKVLGAGANEHGIIFGNWNELLIGLWQSMELIVDPYTKKKRALIEVTSFQMGDVVLRHGESFAKATGATIA